MGIALSIGVLLVVVLWYAFGYIWDYPLRKIRELPLKKLHSIFIVSGLFLSVYIFFPEKTSELLHVSRFAIRTVSVTLTGTLSFMYYYAARTKKSRIKAAYDDTYLAKNITLIILLQLYICVVSLLVVFFKDVLSLPLLPSIALSIWLGITIQAVIWIETELFLDTTKRVWKQKPA